MINANILRSLLIAALLASASARAADKTIQVDREQGQPVAQFKNCSVAQQFTQLLFIVARGGIGKFLTNGRFGQFVKIGLANICRVSFRNHNRQRDIILPQRQSGIAKNRIE